ncbi:porin [Marinibactrum halimedae]|uniref:Porin domain-containing protein n=1 Tax=Marinibactrum halimedae TaxID=1444977 RepID=A0AA37T7R5_9GAMM|nr:porin [Marinibactrum halimedae]MCD9457867.1 porin [Marinibactrum halimedae]GLS26312.1 hypothetical protein GCM10007877_20270 [Marinibactrum halimedae]
MNNIARPFCLPGARCLTSVLFFSACLSSASALAEVRFNGFASIYAGTSTEESPELFGYNDDEISFKNESLFGIQMSSDLSDGLTATAQILSRGSDDFDAEFEWAYLTYEFSENAQVSAGRFRIPFYKFSEYLDVGYAFPWARTPRDVYDTSFSTMEGVRLNYNQYFGDWEIAWQAVYGNQDVVLDIDGNLVQTDFTDIMGGSVDFTWNWLSFRLSYSQTDVTFDAGLEGLEPFFSDPAAFDDVLAEDDSGSFAGAGLFIDHNNWLLNTEIIQIDSDDSFSGDGTDAFYVMVGKRFGSVTAMYTYSENEVTNDFDAADSVVDTFPSPAPERPECGATVQDFVRNCVIGQESENSTHGIAVRYDFHPSAAITFDYTFQEYDLFMRQTDLDDVGVFSVVVDVLF